MTEENLAEVESITWPDDGKEMIYIPAGSYTIGSDNDGENTAPAHQVQLAEFYLDRWPVTNAEYKEFITATGHPIPNYNVPWCDTTGYNWDPDTKMYPPDKEDFPVVLVTWEDARAYATWANKRLPTEAEWEAAARGLQARRWPWGNQFKTGCANTAEAQLNGLTPVGHFSPEGDTPEGVMDLIGNIWEWTSSLHIPYPYHADDGRENVASEKWRVLRGASWTNDSAVAHAITRLDGDFLFFSNVGFRCAVSVK